jgi:hypothetical protein
MTPAELRQHKLDRARRQGDIAAIAILEGGRTFQPDPETPMLTGLRPCDCVRCRLTRLSLSA